MRFERVSKITVAALLSIMMAACSSTDTTNDSSDTSMANEQPQTTATTRPAEMSDGLTASERAERDAALTKTVFYFEFDKSDLSADDRAALVHHANRLKSNPNMHIRLEGHADERGTREYNLALGERRAQAVERYLQVQGVSSSQLETISYGEERPANPGSSEVAYSANRRVEMK